MVKFKRVRCPRYKDYKYVNKICYWHCGVSFEMIRLVKKEMGYILT